MSNFLARCAAIGLVGGGFAATGDLGWLAARGLRLVNARTVPTEQPPVEAADASAPFAGAGPALPAPPPYAAPSAPPAPVAADPFRGRPTTPLAADPAPPAAGPDHIDLAALEPGARVTVWTGNGPAPGRCITLDLVAPATGEALLLVAGMPPRRVTVRPAAAGGGSVLVRGGGLVIASAGPARHGRASGETIGPITALTAGRLP